MKIQIAKAIKQGLEVIIKNPAIVTMVIFSGIAHYVVIHLFIYFPKFLLFFPIIPMPPTLTSVLIELLETIKFYILPISILLFLNLIICKMVYDAVKNRVSFIRAVSVSAKKFIFIFIATIFYSLIIGIGLIILQIEPILFLLVGVISSPVIILGIFFSIKFIFFNHTILLDNEKIINSFKKSWQLTKENYWRIFGLLLIFLIPAWILYRIAYAIVFDIPILDGPTSLLIALPFNFIAVLLLSWLISAFTIVYIQLTTNPGQQNFKQENKGVAREGV